MKYDKAVRYLWSEDGEAELCDKTECVLNEPQECYHCGKIIPKGSNAARLICYDGDVYLMHDNCFENNSQPL